MNCIDGIEGVLREILGGFQQRHDAGELDDTEYARNVKTVIDEAASFLENNPEIGTGADLLRGFLYDAAKSWWLEKNRDLMERDARADGVDDLSQDQGWPEYYFDYIYRRGSYPDQSS